MKQRVEEMEREANKLRELQAAAEKQEHGGAGGDASVPMETEDERAQADSRSIFVGNVCLYYLLPSNSKPTPVRSTTLRHQKKFSSTSRRVVPSIG